MYFNFVAALILEFKKIKSVTISTFSHLFDMKTSVLFYVWFPLLLLGLHTGFPRISTSLRIFQFAVIDTVKGFNIVSEARFP